MLHQSGAEKHFSVSDSNIEEYGDENSTINHRLEAVFSVRV